MIVCCMSNPIINYEIRYGFKALNVIFDKLEVTVKDHNGFKYIGLFYRKNLKKVLNISLH